ncbi:MAG TPA: hypothetical protein DCS21_03895 [Gammaproteobacteria bacterium]|nr:hypothetical protein [Gammaproteobacteria bacterium]
MREHGGFGQPLYALYPQIRAVLASELGSDTADLLAEPVVDRAHNRIDWYTEGEPDQPLVVLSDWPEEQRQPLLDRVHALFERGRKMAERYIASGDMQRIQLGAILKAVLSPPTENEVFLVDGRPVVAHWGFSPDRQWAESGVSVRGAFALESPSERVIPDITIPEWEAATLRPKATVTDEPLSASEPSAESTPMPPAESSPDLPPELSPKSPAEPLADVLAKPVEPEESPMPEASLPFDEARPSPVVENSTSALRYVVVGSRYFWSVAVLALLVALGTIFWSMTRSSAPTLPGAATTLAPDTALDGALTEARNVEQALRVRLEQRLADLAQQQSRCALPVGTAPVSVPLAPSVTQDLPVPGIPSTPPITSTALTAGAPTTQAPVTPHSAVIGSVPLSPVAPEARDTTLPQVSPPVADSSSSPSLPALPKPSAVEPVAAESSATAEPSARMLEDVLSDSQPLIAPPPPEPASEPLTQVSPTPEERQEFASRLSASGAKTGAMTATLLWDGNADLDLVVRCPSGETLDYLTPRGCGGALDVDANSTRETLSEKPVENIFWPAGQATPGAYKIAVRYEPRKDERNPRPVPFQIRLIRDSQERVFKGTVRPHKTLSIANFTVVER